MRMDKKLYRLYELRRFLNDNINVLNDRGDRDNTYHYEISRMEHYINKISERIIKLLDKQYQKQYKVSKLYRFKRWIGLR